MHWPLERSYYLAILHELWLWSFASVALHDFPNNQFIFQWNSIYCPSILCFYFSLDHSNPSHSISDSRNFVNNMPIPIKSYNCMSAQTYYCIEPFSTSPIICESVFRQILRTCYAVHYEFDDFNRITPFWRPFLLPFRNRSRTINELP